jgi:uncharacterized protein (TIGR00266 family)
MDVEILYQPSYALAIVTLDRGEAIHAESGAMVSMSPDMEMETAARGGLLKSLARSMFGGESFFINTYTGTRDGSRISVAPPLPGDITVIDMQGETLLVQSGSYLASASGVEVDTKWSGAKTFFGSEGLIMLKLSGAGMLIVSSYGAIHPMELEAGQKVVVDTGHLVAFEEQLDFQVKKVAGWKSTLFSGEGLVIELTGPGKVYLQTRSQDSFLSWLIPRIPRQTTTASSGS